MNNIHELNTKEEVDELLATFTKEIHFYLDVVAWSSFHKANNGAIAYTFDTTREFVICDEPLIHTCQLACLSFDLLLKGYRIFVHRGIKTLEFKPYMDYHGTKEIRFAHNIEKLVRVGFFDADFA